MKKKGGVVRLSVGCVFTVMLKLDQMRFTLSFRKRFRVKV